MRMLINNPNIQIDDTLRHAAEQTLHVVLGRISDRIDHVSITLTDVNALKGGEDKQCRVNVTVRGLGTVSAEGRGQNVLPSIDKVLRRARRVILKRLKRRVSRSRRQPDITRDVVNAA